MFQRGKHVRSEAKTVVCNIYNYILGITIGSVSRKVKATVVQIIHDKRRLAEGKHFPTPTKCYRGS